MSMVHSHCYNKLDKSKKQQIPYAQLIAKWTVPQDGYIFQRLVVTNTDANQAINVIINHDTDSILVNAVAQDMKRAFSAFPVEKGDIIVMLMLNGAQTSDVGATLTTFIPYK